VSGPSDLPLLNFEPTLVQCPPSRLSTNNLACNFEKITVD